MSAVADTGTTSAVERPEIPSHVLMHEQHIDLRDPKLDNDYLARRHRCLQKANKSEKTVPNADPDENDDALWSGATTAERALVACCDVDGGCISRGKEVDFLGVIARHCHSTATQALALAILQRTIDRPKEEEEESASDEEDDSSQYSTEDDGSEASAEEKETDSSKDEKNGSEKDKGTSSKDEKEEDIDRISPFLAAGGLQTLRDWLVDATTPVTTPAQRPSSPTPNRKLPSPSPTPAEVTQTDPPTGPILLPLLSLLESIPFHKKLVTDTKINKNIRNLKRKLGEAISSFNQGNGNGSTVKLEEWRHPAAGGNVVVLVQKAVESLMQSWQEKAKESTGEADAEDPFASLRNKLRKRVGILLEYEESSGSKPEWLLRMEESDPKKSPPDPKKVAQAASDRLTAHQLEALEHKKERDRIRDAMKKTQQERQEAKEKLEQLRSKIQKQDMKRKAQKELHVKKKHRKVQWKDGLNNSVSLRRRHLLEVVHEYPSDPGEDGSEAKVSTNNKENVGNEAVGEVRVQHGDLFFDDMDGIPLANDEKMVQDLTDEVEGESDGATSEDLEELWGQHSEGVL